MCAEERNALPYEVQQRWLALYEREFAKDFRIDQATLVLITQCSGPNLPDMYRRGAVSSTVIVTAEPSRQ